MPYLNTINLQKEVYYIIMHTLQPAPLLKQFFFKELLNKLFVTEGGIS